MLMLLSHAEILEPVIVAASLSTINITCRLKSLVGFLSSQR